MSRRRCGLRDLSDYVLEYPSCDPRISSNTTMLASSRRSAPGASRSPRSHQSWLLSVSACRVDFTQICLRSCSVRSVQLSRHALSMGGEQVRRRARRF